MGKARKFVCLQINKHLYQLSGADLFINLATFLRENLRLTATKIACEEGDCGACSVLLGIPYTTPEGQTMRYQVVNSCIIPVFSLDAMHIITLEGLNEENLSVIQKAMVAKGGAQCGFCTPGMIISLVDFFEHTNNKNVSKEIREKLKGNLCRCTGYQPIINAALSVTKEQYSRFTKGYAIKSIAKKLLKKQQEAIIYESDEVSLWIPSHLDDALTIKKRQKNSQLCAGTSDLAVLWNKEKWNKEQWNKKEWNKAHLKKEQITHKNLLSLQKIPSLYLIEETKKTIKFGAQVTLQQIQDYLTDHGGSGFKQGSKQGSKSGFKPFCDLLDRFGSPQVKNRATLTGNVANASPVGDTIPFLMIMKAKVELQQLEKYRLAKINTFFKGYKKLAIKDNEIITGIILPKLKKRQQCFIYKVSQRYDVDISCVSAAFLIKLSKTNKNNKGKNKVKQIRIAFAGVAPYVIRLYDAEQIMQDRVLNQQLIEEVIAVALSGIKPLTDIRGSEKFRRKLIENIFRKFYFEIVNPNVNRS